MSLCPASPQGIKHQLVQHKQAAHGIPHYSSLFLSIRLTFEIFKCLYSKAIIFLKNNPTTGMMLEGPLHIRILKQDTTKSQTAQYMNKKDKVDQLKKKKKKEYNKKKLSKL